MYLNSFSIYLCLNVKWLIVHKFVHLLKDNSKLKKLVHIIQDVYDSHEETILMIQLYLFFSNPAE